MIDSFLHSLYLVSSSFALSISIINSLLLSLPYRWFLMVSLSLSCRPLLLSFALVALSTFTLLCLSLLSAISCSRHPLTLSRSRCPLTLPLSHTFTLTLATVFPISIDSCSCCHSFSLSSTSDALSHFQSMLLYYRLTRFLREIDTCNRNDIIDLFVERYELFVL